MNEFYGGNMYPLPAAAPPYLEDERPKDPDKMSAMEKERYGVEDTYDEESATFMDKGEPVIAQKRTDYSDDQVGCGEKFHPEITREGSDKNAPCGQSARAPQRKKHVNSEEIIAEAELLENQPDYGFSGSNMVE